MTSVCFNVLCMDGEVHTAASGVEFKFTVTHWKLTQSNLSCSPYFFFLSELMISDRHQKREIRQLEQELPRWQVLVDSITGYLSFHS